MFEKRENYELHNGDCLEIMDKLIKEGKQRIFQQTHLNSNQKGDE